MCENHSDSLEKIEMDYLNTLQWKFKCIVEKDSLTVELMILVKEECLPVCKWALDHISKIYTRLGGKVTVVKIRTKSGGLKVSITKIAILPIDNLKQK